jgi:Domain of unknown function (DUF4118)
VPNSGLSVCRWACWVPRRPATLTPFKIRALELRSDPDRRAISSMTADREKSASWAVLGGVVGVLFAWICEPTGHAPWAVALMLACSVVPTFVVPLPDHRPLRELSIWCFSQPKSTRAALVFILIAMTLILNRSLEMTPRAYNYLPFLPAVIASNILFGAGSALFAMVLSLVISDYLFVAPVSDLSTTMWEQIVTFASFAAIGAGIAWLVVSFVTVLSQDERNIFNE